jgi:hypothetical protein
MLGLPGEEQDIVAPAHEFADRDVRPVVPDLQHVKRQTRGI